MPGSLWHAWEFMAWPMPGSLCGLVSSLCHAPGWDGKPREQTAGGVVYLEWDGPSHAWIHDGLI